MTDEEDIIEQRIRGRSVRAIAKAHGCGVRDINQILDRFAEATIDEGVRRHALALELARLDRLQEIFYQRGCEGDVASAALVAKLVERRCCILGLTAPPATTFTVIDQVAPTESSTDRIAAALDGLRSRRALTTTTQ